MCKMYLVIDDNIFNIMAMHMLLQELESRFDENIID
jgi:hypothetical protein